MMVSFFAIAYNTARLGFEAQNAAAIRLLRLANGVSQVTLDRVPEQITTAVEVPTEAVVIRPKMRAAKKKVHKRSAPIRKRSNRAK
jgi:hypothetical protein